MLFRSNTQTVGIAIRDDVTTEGSVIEYQEQDSTWALLGQNGSSGATKTLKRNFSFAKQNKAKYINNENKGTIAANPTELGHFHVFAGNPFSIDSGPVRCMVHIRYEVLFTELKDLTGS